MRFKHVLVPIDLSDRNARLLGTALALAEASGAGATVRLLHVAPIPGNVVSQEGRVVALADQEMERLETEGLEYLQAIGARLGLAAECVVRFGADSEEILREAEAWGADLVTMSTAGKSGLKRMVMGSVAEQVFRRAHVPVLLYHPGPASG